MAHRIIGSFKSKEAADAVVQELVSRGFSSREISMLMSADRRREFVKTDEDRVPPPEELNEIVSRMESLRPNGPKGPQLDRAGPLFLEITGMTVRPSVIYPDPQPSVPPESGAAGDRAPNEEMPLERLAQEEIIVGVEVPEGKEADRIREIFREAGATQWDAV